MRNHFSFPLLTLCFKLRIPVADYHNKTEKDQTPYRQNGLFSVKSQINVDYLSYKKKKNKNKAKLLKES